MYRERRSAFPTFAILEGVWIATLFSFDSTDFCVKLHLELLRIFFTERVGSLKF